ncbi:MAG: xylose isomerase [Flavobacteriales bacterium]|nr:MAG: xylose isomerase [Flavobacteriales bacterium]
MIYISSSCVKANKIKDSVLELARNGFRNIELSGGTKPYPDLVNDLLKLKDEYKLNYLCHNYFPPPKKPFVLNLASLNDDIYNMSLTHLISSIELSHKLGAKKFGFHAGFLINIPISQIGNSIKNQNLFNRTEAINRFKNGVSELINASNKFGVNLYIENNVLSRTNYENFNSIDPFLFTASETLNEILLEGVKPLIDFAHLKVSCNVLQLDLKKELNKLINKTDYIHLSDNNGLTDQNKEITTSSEIFDFIPPSDFKGKDITLEIYDSLDIIKESFTNVKNHIEK